LWVIVRASYGPGLARSTGRALRSFALLAAIGLWGCHGGGTGPAAPDATRTTLDAADRALAAHDYDTARSLYRRAVDQAPDDAHRAAALHELIEALLLFGERDAAADALVELCRLRPDDPRPFHDLGVVRAALGDAAGAERALRTARHLAPDDPRPRIALAALLVNGHRLDAALAEYRALLALELAPRLRQAVERGIELIEAAQRHGGPPSTGATGH
jgi:Flp pilus assembly protein TadD